MQIYTNNDFDQSLDEILDYIALDSLEKALDFVHELQTKFETLPFMPYKFRKSIYFDNENIRDFIYKGYVIPYLVDQECIVILGIVKYRETL